MSQRAAVPPATQICAQFSCARIFVQLFAIVNSVNTLRSGRMAYATLLWLERDVHTPQTLSSDRTRSPRKRVICGVEDLAFIRHCAGTPFKACSEPVEGWGFISSGDAELAPRSCHFGRSEKSALTDESTAGTPCLFLSSLQEQGGDFDFQVEGTALIFSLP